MTRREAGDPEQVGRVVVQRVPGRVAPLFGASPTANPVSQEEDRPDMSEPGPARAVYDHTEEEPRPTGRRRRQVADWGVGEELFDGMPGGRFERRVDHRIPRGGVDDGRRTIVIADAGSRRRSRPSRSTRSSPAARRRCAPARSTTPSGAATSRSPTARSERARPEATPQRPRTRCRRDRPRRRRRPAHRQDRRPPAGVPQRPRARRRTVHERVGPRPDRIAAWAVALGLLLILIAIVT